MNLFQSTLCTEETAPTTATIDKITSSYGEQDGKFS